MRPDLYAFLLDAAYQDWCRWRAEYFGLEGRAPAVSTATLRRLDVVIVNMDRCMRDYMLVAAQRAEFEPEAGEAAQPPQRAALTLVEHSGAAEAGRAPSAGRGTAR
ncbi:MAG TPA: hypothetical protein VNU71_01180 [Burkholderiaceae bacterium]|nr:hypothetical protein [Burkholderiaceae bacterium]